MNKTTTSQALTSGLLAGYGGKTEFKSVIRGGFDLKSSHFENNGIVYHDEWTNGGGQEIIKVGNEMFTRVYAGHTFTENKEIISKLINFIQQLGNKTRLFSNCKSVDSEWAYQYKILDTESDITSSKETIEFQNQIVFVHYFILSPIIK